MGTGNEGFGHDSEQEGKEAAEKTREGEMSKEELKEKYKEAKDIGQGEEFKKGYAEGSNG